MEVYGKYNGMWGKLGKCDIKKNKVRQGLFDSNRFKKCSDFAYGENGYRRAFKFKNISQSYESSDKIVVTLAKIEVMD